MKATLEFNLPDDQWAFDNAVNASDYVVALNEIRQAVRSHNKYDVDAGQTLANISEILADLRGLE